MQEIWASCIIFPDYEISSYGRVKRITPASGTYIGKILKPKYMKSGYCNYSLMQNRKHIFILAQRLICETFHGAPLNPKYEAAHNDGVRSNNCADNLRWATPKENRADKKLHGTWQGGSKHGNALLNEESVVEVIKLYAQGLSQAAIGRQFNVTRSTINKITRGKHWKHVSPPLEQT